MGHRLLLLLVLALSATAPAAPPTARLQVDGSTVTAFSAETGQPIWRFDAGMRLFEPVAANGTLFLTGTAGRLYALDARSGLLRWRFTTGDDWLYPPAVVGNRLLLVGRESGLYALSPEEGRLLWHRPLEQEPVYRPVAVGDDSVLLPLFDGSLSRFSARNGELLWRTRLPSPVRNLTVTGGAVLFGGYDNNVRAIDSGSGKLRWSRPLSGRVATPPVIARGRIQVETDEGRRYLLRLTDGLPETRPGNEPPGKPVLLPGRPFDF